MKASEAQVIIDVLKSLVDGEKPREVVATGVQGEKLVRPGKDPAPQPAITHAPGVPFIPIGQEFDALYQRIKTRFIEEARIDPILLQLIMQRTELVVEIEPRVVVVDGMGSLKGRVARLMAQGWFATARATSAVRKELARTGTDPGGGGGLSTVLTDYVKDGFLTREGDGYLLAPSVKVTEREIVAR